MSYFIGSSEKAVKEALACWTGMCGYGNLATQKPASAWPASVLWFYVLDGAMAVLYHVPGMAMAIF